MPFPPAAPPRLERWSLGEVVETYKPAGQQVAVLNLRQTPVHMQKPLVEMKLGKICFLGFSLGDFRPTRNLMPEAGTDIHIPR